MSAPPSIDALLAEWWGGGGPGDGTSNPVDPWFTFNPATAANLFFGGNPVYQLSDFLAFYPKFGTYAQAVSNVAPNATTPGINYLANDVLTLTQPDASGSTVTVIAINGSGSPTSYQVTAQGSGYSVATGLPTTGGSGTGALVDITQLVPYSGLVPQIVIQTYLNLALACLQSARWGEQWKLAVGLFIAHYVTLYLDSDGSPVTTPGQAAVTGLAKGIAVSKAAGDVSVGYETLKDLESWAAWGLTKYGQQLATMAKIVGMGPMYIL